MSASRDTTAGQMELSLLCPRTCRSAIICRDDEWWVMWPRSFDGRIYEWLDARDLSPDWTVYAPGERWVRVVGCRYRRAEE